MSLDASELTGLGSVNTGGETSPTGAPGAGLTQITSTGGTIAVSSPLGPVVNIETVPFPGYGAANGVVGPSVPGAATTVARSDHQHPTIDVANQAALAAFDFSATNPGTRVWTDTYKCGFTLMLGAAAMAAAAHVRIAATGKAGYFLVRDDVSPSWWPQLTWEVNPSTGNDENDGATSGTPLATFAELNRRMRGRNLPGTETNSITINLRGSSPADTDFVQIHFDPNARAGNVSVTVSGSAAAVAVPIGTINSVVAKNATTNTPFQILKAGFDFSPFVGDIIHIVGTPGTSAVVEKAPALGTAELSCGVVAGSANDAPFAAGNNVEGYTKLRIPGINMSGVDTFISLVDLDVGLAASGTTIISTGQIQAQRCRFPRGIVTGFITGVGLAWLPTGCSFQGSCFISAGIFSPVAGAVVAGTLTLPAASARHHLSNFGLRNSRLVLSNQAFVRFNGDFHSFDGPAGFGTIVMNRWSFIEVANAIYGQGNNATAALVAMPAVAVFNYFGLPTWTSAAATPIGAYIDGDSDGGTFGGTAVPIGGGLGVGWPITPGTCTDATLLGAIQSKKLNAVIPG